MKTRVKYYLVFTILLVLFSTCEKDWKKVNINPNLPENLSSDSILPSAIMSMGAVVGYHYNLVGGCWSQYWTMVFLSSRYSKYYKIDTYTLTSSDINEGWQELYSGALPDLEYMVENASQSKDWNYFLIGTVLQCYSYQLLVDLYGSIPYSEALQGNNEPQNFYPKFDDAETVYNDLIVKLNDALSKDFKAVTCTNPGKSDLLFSGDMSKWIQFANTLKLKIFMRQMYVRPAVAQAGIQKLYTDHVSFLSSDAQITQFSNEVGKMNPFYELEYYWLSTRYIGASSTLFLYLTSNSDPRRYFLFENKIGYSSLLQGQIPISAVQFYGPSIFISRALDPVVFISSAESFFLQAEAVAKGWGTGNDQAIYNSGIEASFIKSGKTASDAALYTGLGNVYEYPVNGSFEEKQKAIIMQKWISMAGYQGIESFFETNRTHYPPIYLGFPSPNWKGGEFTRSMEAPQGTLFPKRMLFPATERSLNPNAPAEISLFTKVWWDVKP